MMSSKRSLGMGSFGRVVLAISSLYWFTCSSFSIRRQFTTNACATTKQMGMWGLSLHLNWSKMQCISVFHLNRFQRRNLVGFAAIGLVIGFWEWCFWLLLVLDMWCAWAAVHGGYLLMFELLLPWCDFYSTMTRIASWVLCGSVDKNYNCLSTVF